MTERKLTLLEDGIFRERKADERLESGTELPAEQQSAERFVDRLTELGWLVREHMNIVFVNVQNAVDNTNPRHLTIPGELAGYLTLLDKGTPGVRQIRVDPVPANYVRCMLEKKYGPALAQSDVYATMGLTGSEPIDPLALGSKLEFFEPYTQLSERHVRLRHNPYLFLLTLPLETRPFFTRAVARGSPLLQPHFRNDFVCELKLEHVLAQAEADNELSRVGLYINEWIARGGEPL
jgi:hypothetical protein